MTMTPQRTSRLEKLTTALREIRDNRQQFTPEAYHQIVLALLDKRRVLQTVRTKDSPAIGADEIRLVTVMFIDVKDSTELARRVEDEEAWKSIINIAHERMARLIAEYDGEVGQYLGDGLLSFFGAHRSRGDDALRAVACAVALQADIQTYATDVQRQYHAEFNVRIGISTGRVVVGMIGGTQKQEFLALGLATNLAARLQAICEPGQILIDEHTHHRVRNHFITQEQTPTLLKGFEKPTVHYSVQGRRQQPNTQLTRDQVAGLELAFVGREDELKQIARIWQLALEDEEFHVITIYGDIGMGKSRLMQSVLVQAADRHFSQLTMIARYEKRTTSHNLLRDFLSTRCNLTDDMSTGEAESRILSFVKDQYTDTDADAVAAIAGYLAGFGFDDSPHIRPLLSGGRGQERVAYAKLGQWFKALATTGFLLIAVDNLQWADAASIELLDYLAQYLSDKAGILITTARTEFKQQTPKYMEGNPRHCEITLRTLHPMATSAIVSLVLDQIENVPSTLSSTISERAAGNPLFIEEFLDMLFNNGVFEQREEGDWRYNHYRYLMIDRLPDGLQDILQSRLDDLEPSTRQVVQIAAVIGQTFWAGALRHMLKVPVDTALSDLETRNIIIRSTEGGFENDQQFHFRHTLYREVAYEMLPRAKREQYHHEVAEWLSQRVASHPEHLGMLAEHYENGNLHERAVETYLAAIENRMERGLLDTALKLIERGLAITGQVPREVALPSSIEMWVTQAQAFNALARYDEASSASRAAQRLLSEMPKREMLEERIRAGRMLGTAMLSLGKYDDAFLALRQAYDLLPDGDIVVQHANVLRSFGSLFLCRGQLGEGLSYQQRALSHAQELKAEPQIASSMTQLGLIALDRGDLATALSYFERVLDMNRKRDNIYYQVLDLRNMGMAYRAVFAYEMALDVLDRANDLLEYLHFSDPLLQANRALCLIALGQSTEGLKLLQQAAEEKQQNVNNRHLVQLLLINGLALTGQYITCRDVARAFVEDVKDVNAILHGRGMMWLGMAVNALGDPLAKDLLNAALQSELVHGGRDAWLCYYLLGTVTTDSQQAHDHYDKATMILSSIHASLHTRPELQTALMNDRLVKQLFATVREHAASQ